MRTYATEDDYRTWSDSATAVSLMDLQRASRAVDYELRTAVYDTDVDGYPMDAAILQTFKDATLIQLHAILVATALTDAAGIPSNLASSSIDGVSYTFRSPVADSYAIPPDGGLCAEARRVLALGGLTQGVYFYG